MSKPSKEDEVLKRLLKMKPEPFTPKKKLAPKKAKETPKPQK